MENKSIYILATPPKGSNGYKPRMEKVEVTHQEYLEEAEEGETFEEYFQYVLEEARAEWEQKMWTTLTLSDQELQDINNDPLLKGN